MKRLGPSDPQTIKAAFNLVINLSNDEQYPKAKNIICETDLISIFHRTYGADNVYTFQARGIFAETLINSDGATSKDLREAVDILEDATRRARRVLGKSHPEYRAYEQRRDFARERLKRMLLAGA